MKRSEFQEQYNLAAPILNRNLEVLESHIETNLTDLKSKRVAAGLPQELFRVRLKESRVKKCDSLYEKISNDAELSFNDAFKPGHVRDLLGVRVVCHNLEDVLHIVGTLKQAKWGALSYVEPPKGEKCWLRDCHPESGYRGYHVDVRWPNDKGEYAYAELQVRTLLQDAWATFMHDDVYKGGQESSLITDFVPQFKDMSNILYALDEMAQRIRGSIETSRVGGAKLRLSESISRAMFATLAYAKVAKEIPPYREISRSDTYLVDAETAEFEFLIYGKLRTPETFKFPVAGDTSRDNAVKLRIDQEVSKGKWKALKQPKLRNDRDQSNSIIFRHNEKSSFHRYRIRCQWRGVFANGDEYIWCPWASTYRGAMKSYKLRLIFPIQPLIPPVIFSFSDYTSIQDMLESAAGGKGGRQLNITADSRGICYTCEMAADSNDDLICFFRLGRD